MEDCEFNALNSGENYPIWFSDTFLKLSERGTNNLAFAPTSLSTDPIRTFLIIFIL